MRFYPTEPPPPSSSSPPLRNDVWWELLPWWRWMQVEARAGRRQDSRNRRGWSGCGSPLFKECCGAEFLAGPHTSKCKMWLWPRNCGLEMWSGSDRLPDFQAEVFFLSRDRSFHDHQRPLRVPSQRSCHTRECLCPGVKQAKENIDLGLGSGPVLSHRDLGLHICKS